jgi:hypothetical protein
LLPALSLLHSISSADNYGDEDSVGEEEEEEKTRKEPSGTGTSHSQTHLK